MRHYISFILIGLFALLYGCSYDMTEDFGPRPSIESIASERIEKNNSEAYYYYFNEKIPLSEKKDLILVCFVDAPSRTSFIHELSSVSSLKVWNPAFSDHWDEDNDYNILILQSSSESEIPTEQIAALEDNPGIRCISFLMDCRGSLISTSDQFAVKLRDLSDYSQLGTLVRDNACVIERCKDPDEGIYYIRRQKESTLGTILLANAFYETGVFEFSAPEFYCFDSESSSDPYYSDQWGLKNTGQYGSAGIDIDVETAWNTTEGSNGIVIAIIDDGVELTHPELVSNTISGHDVVSPSGGSGEPHSQYEKHGTAVAGIINAKKNNSLGISGVAPDCKIMPIRAGSYIAQIGNSAYLPSDLCEAVYWARTHGADIINCSWGQNNPDPTLTSEMQNAARYGRNGKGCVIICSSGNEYSGNNGTVKFPASLSCTLAVGAISYDGKRVVFSSPGISYPNFWSSCYGNELDVVAPGVLIPTTDRTGSDGYSNLDYYMSFGGTSAAAPHVTGIAALVLSKYPVLSQEEVRMAITKGTTTLPDYNYQYIGTYPNINNWNPETGYGLANASEALEEASAIYALEYTPGIDFTIINSSSYDLTNVIIDVQGSINGQTEWLISSDIAGSIASGEQVGYPDYRGYSLAATPGTPIGNISFDLYACCIDCPGNLEIGVDFDTPAPNSYQQFSFGEGNSFHTTLTNITVPCESRRRIYVRIFDIP